MQEDLQRQMARRAKYLRSLPDDLRPDEMVAVKEGRKWLRGAVLAVLDYQARIDLKDWSRKIWRPIYECYQLQDQFRKLRWQSVPCALAYVGPTKDTGTWPRKTRELIKLLAEGKTGWIEIKRPVNNDAAYVELRINNGLGNGSFNLAEILANLGHVDRTDCIGQNIFPGITHLNNT